MEKQNGGFCGDSLRILIAVKPESLSRVISYLIGNVSGIAILSCVNDARQVVRHAERILPHLIIVNDRAIGPDAPGTIEALKNASPGAKVVLTFWAASQYSDFPHCNADARIDEASLTKQLAPVLLKLCTPRRQVVSQEINRQEYQ